MEYEKIRYKVKGQLVDHCKSSFDVKTSTGFVHFEPNDIKAFLNGDLVTIMIEKKK